MDKSFEILIHENRDMMLTYAKALLDGDGHRAEDVVQEASLVAWNKLDQFDSSRSFPKWLRGIVRLKALESSRVRERSPWIADPEVIAGMEEIYQNFDRRRDEEEWLDRVATLQQCINKLNDRMRNTVELVYQAELSLKEVADKMSINIMTAGKRISRARKLIRTCMQKQKTLELS